MKRQAWWCEACGARGFVDHANDASVMQVSLGLVGDHRERSPGCDGGEFIRAQNEAWVDDSLVVERRGGSR